MIAPGLHKIAERYARALFALAQKQDVLDTIEQEMQALAAAVEASEELQEFMKNPLLTRAQKAQAMQALLAKMQAGKLAQDFIKRLSYNRRLEALPAIAEAFDRMAMESRGEQVMEVISAQPLDEAQLRNVKDALAKASGAKVRIRLVQDLSILGGLVVKAGGVRYDFSVRGGLNRLKKTLKESKAAA